jgi:PKD repeat protein
MKRSIIYLSILLTFCVGCKRVEVDFSYTPTAPRAGEAVKFTNLCTEGEEWLWTFGDNITNLAKNPKHIYKKPGTYLVTLMVDSAKYNTCTKQITVYDTVPTFVCSTDSILHYQDVTFTANVYNPFNHTLTYKWILPQDCEIVSGTLDNFAITVFFTYPLQDSVQLLLTQKDTTYSIKKAVKVHLTKAPAIVMCKTDQTIIRQRLINDRIEQPTTATTDKDLYAIEHACDTAVTFNGKTFYANTLASTISGFNGLDIQRVQIDAMAQKWYVTTPEGLYVANFDGSNMVSIDENATGAIYVDINRNRLYWASNTGTYAMPLIKSKNNQYTTIPAQYNNLNNIDLITVNNTPQ